MDSKMTEHLTGLLEDRLESAYPYVVTSRIRTWLVRLERKAQEGANPPTVAMRLLREYYTGTLEECGYEPLETTNPDSMREVLDVLVTLELSGALVENANMGT
jgi:hypothetical protein